MRPPQPPSGSAAGKCLLVTCVEWSVTPLRSSIVLGLCADDEAKKLLLLHSPSAPQKGQSGEIVVFTRWCDAHTVFVVCDVESNDAILLYLIIMFHSVPPAMLALLDLRQL